MHRITQWGEYGVHIVLYLAERAAIGSEIIGAGEISESQNIALNYTQQILLRLKTSDIVESIRGPKGGYCLKKIPSEISLHEILVATEGDTAEVICESNKIEHQNCAPDKHCVLKGVWYGLKDVINSYLTAITIEDLLHEKSSSNGKYNLVNLPLSLSNVESEKPSM